MLSSQLSRPFNLMLFQYRDNLLLYSVCLCGSLKARAAGTYFCW
ncbi:hypothetical protein ABIC07_008371 [Bradyrhizobium sp. RT9a]